MNIKLLGLSVALFSHYATAQNFEHCNSLIEHGVTNVTRHMSAEHSIAYKWHSNCGLDLEGSSDSSVRKASISIFGYGSGSGDSNSSQMKKRIKQWCDKNADFAQSKQDLYEEARIVSKPALDAWNRCQSISQKGVFITPSIQGENDEFIHFTIDSTSNGTHLFYGVSQSGYSCIIEQNDGSEVASDRIDKGEGESFIMTKSRPAIDNSNIHINCRRNNPKVSEVAGVGTLKYAQGHISVMTSGPALPITIPKVVESYNVTPPKSVLAFAANSCPEGWTDYVPAYGRFIRGIDKNKEPVDKGGKRKVGDIQQEQVGSHTHKYSRVTAFYGHNYSGGQMGWATVPKSGEALRHSGEGGDGSNKYRAGVRTAIENTESMSSKIENRPVNVSLLYCIKN